MRRKLIILLTLQIILVWSFLECRVSYEQLSLEKKAQQTTVYIKAQDLGSGVIIGHHQNNYYVLTARHVVGTPPGQIEDPYTVTLSDNQEYKLDYNRIIKDNQLDLAIIQFESDKNYSVVALNGQLQEQQNVSISGWRECSGKPKWEFTSGKIGKIVSSVENFSESDKNKIDNFEQHYNEGNRVKYTNPTIQGMSGSGVFNQKGEVVAIHTTSGDRRTNNPQTCDALDKNYNLNWGIPIQAFLNSKLSKKIPSEAYKNSF